MKCNKKEPFKFVGKQLCTDASDEAVWKLIMKKDEESMLKIGEMLIGSAQKMLILDAGLMSMLS